MSWRQWKRCRTSSVHQIRCQHDCSRNVSASFHRSCVSCSTCRLSTARSHRVSNASTLRRCWKKQISIRPTSSPTGRSRTCPSFPSCLSDSLARSLWNTPRTITCFQIFSQRIEQCTQRKQLFSRYWLIYRWRWTRVIWRCWHYLSAAFDSVDHDTLLNRLQKSYGLGGSRWYPRPAARPAAVRLECRRPFVFSARRSERITPLLRELHWLRVPERFTFRLSVLAYRCLHGTAPAYLARACSGHLTSAVDAVCVLSHAGGTVVPSTRRSTFGDCAFPVASVRAWNSLPSSVRNAPSLTTFRRELKTVLFRASFDNDYIGDRDCTSQYNCCLPATTDCRRFSRFSLLFLLILYGAPTMSLTWQCHLNQYIVTYLGLLTSAFYQCVYTNKFCSLLTFSVLFGERRDRRINVEVRLMSST